MSKYSCRQAAASASASAVAACFLSIFFCAALHISISPQNLPTSIYQHSLFPLPPPLPLPLTVCLLFMFAVDLQLQILLRLRSFVCYVFFPCLPDKGSDTVCMRVRPCVSVCACECVGCMAHSIESTL